MKPCYDKIPSLNFHDFLSKNDNKKQNFIYSLGKAYQQLGFVTIKNHNLDEQFIKKLFNVYHQFFNLSEETKNRYYDEKLCGERGYTGKMRECAKGFKEPDLKEFFHVGQEGQRKYPVNIWPSEIPDFKKINIKAYQALENIGFSILEALTSFLNLPHNFLKEKVTHGNSVLRAIHYFPIQNNHPTNAVRAAEHCDINFITVLMSASAEGLQVKRHDGKWIDVKPDPDTIIINVGDMLSRMTNNRLKSTVHRVINPSLEKMHEPRYSIPFFMHPKPDVNLASLESCVDRAHPKLYKDITAGEFLYQRLVENGLKG
ncbi:isopenicillin N synthase family dioxygenase [Candidatus Uabimicrobium sp. HlEnr_7]|uniref:isopenicillin N synthase family dioxygenase n=1 Tax=Candidatus Uabimicrobium helgolandensis TaxID=3095367 RepID=UPI0035569913